MQKEIDEEFLSTLMLPLRALTISSAIDKPTFEPSFWILGGVGDKPLLFLIGLIYWPNDIKRNLNET